MKKIPTLFRRDPDDMKRVLPTVSPGCEWVLAGEGRATRKFDGMCVLVRDGSMYAREQVKEGGAPPPDFEAIDFDEATGKTQGWVPVTDAKQFRRHWEAYCLRASGPPDGTYELCGPKVNGNPEGFESHVLVPHGADELKDVLLPPTTVERQFEALGMYLRMNAPMEGIVWHHPDGRMAKLKRRDFT